MTFMMCGAAALKEASGIRDDGVVLPTRIVAPKLILLVLVQRGSIEL